MNENVFDCICYDIRNFILQSKGLALSKNDSVEILTKKSLFFLCEKIGKGK